MDFKNMELNDETRKEVLEFMKENKISNSELARMLGESRQAINYVLRSKGTIKGSIPFKVLIWFREQTKEKKGE